MKNSRKQSIALVLSVVLHGAVFAFLLLNPDFAMKPVNHHVQVELMDPKDLLQSLQAPPQMPKEQIDSPKGQIVEQDEKAINDELDKQAKFLSRHNQKVIREEQAATHGKFKNTDNSGGEKAVQKEIGKVADHAPNAKEADKDQKDEQKAEKPDPTFMTSEDGVASGRTKKPSMKDLTPSFKPGPPPSETATVAKGGGEGPSATDDHLKNVKTGMQTMLSTREFVYYSYYNRIKDKLRQYWEPKIKEKVERIVRQGRTIASADRVTRIVITLDKSGTLVRVQIVGASGVNDLDEAAVEAFRAAAPFPNPPKGIVDPDGTIKIRWDFILEADAGDGFSKALRIAQAAL